MKSYLEILSSIHKTNFRELEIGSDKVSDLLENIIVWIIGLSTGSIALIIAATGKINIQQNYINVTLLFLVLSIVFGVFGRAFSAISSYLGYKFGAQFKLMLAMFDIPFKIRALKGDETAVMIYSYLKDDYNEDYPSILENAKLVNGKALEDYNSQLREFYTEFTNNKKTEMLESTKAMNKLLAECFGINPDRIEKMKKPTSIIKGLFYRASAPASSALYFLSGCSFLTAVVFISIKYYCAFK